jgi:hypothetical protein
MITEIFPALYLLRPAKPPPNTQFTYLLKRPDGNVLFGTKHDVRAHAAAIEALGGVAQVLLGDRHHALPATSSLARRLGTELTASKIEAKALAAKGVKVGRQLELERQSLGPDLEALPTPGHTRGAFSYLWTAGGRRFLFIGDTLVPVDGAWEYWVVPPNRAQMLGTVDALSRVEFDVILSNSFAASPTAWMEVDGGHRRKMFADLRARLSRP